MQVFMKNPGSLEFVVDLTAQACFKLLIIKLDGCWIHKMKYFLNRAHNYKTKDVRGKKDNLQCLKPPPKGSFKFDFNKHSFISASHSIEKKAFLLWLKKSLAKV